MILMFLFKQIKEKKENKEKIGNFIFFLLIFSLIHLNHDVYNIIQTSKS